MRVKFLMGVKVWSSWGVADQISKSPYVGLLPKNHGQLQKNKESRVIFVRIKFS